MKKILFLGCLLTGILTLAQAQLKSSRVATKGPTISQQQATKITPVNAEKTEPVFSTYTKMKLKLPFAAKEKEYMVQKVGHFYVLNGDIIVGNDFPKIRANSVENKDYRWANGYIPYVIDPSITHKYFGKAYEIGAAIAEFNSRSKLCLKPRTTEKDYVRFILSLEIPGAGLSDVGRQGGEQGLYLNKDATKGTVIHELMHAAGFYHEQSREDRDQYVKINEANIKKGLENNFQIEGMPRSDYDYGSIMHYSQKAFSKNELPTIECIKNGVVVACAPGMGQREELSAGDIHGISWFYSNTSNFPCEAFVPNPFPEKFPSAVPVAAESAMAAFRHRTDVAYKERHVSEFIKIVGAYPNFHEVTKGLNTVGGTVFLYNISAQWQDVPLAELGSPPLNDFMGRMRATQVYAVQNGFIGGFPTFYHADYGKGVVCGTVLIRPGGAEWRDVPLADLGNPSLDDIRARMTSANDYAFRNGFLGGFPTFFHADYGKGIVCGIVLIKKEAGEWRDVITVQGPR